jgi:hypothetical protein
MKNILGLLFLLLILNGCDDGDLTVENIDFATVTTNTCGETLYKLNGNEALFIKIPSSLNAFPNEIRPADSPLVIPIGGNVSVTYRAYDGVVGAGNICSTPSPIAPIATEEWIATAGTIEISTIAVYTTNETTGATAITRFVHNIIFKNIVFSKPSGTQIYERFVFGEYSTTTTVLPFDFNPDEIRLCSNNVLYNARTNGIEGIAIDNFDTSLLSTDNLGVTKVGLISSTSNKLLYLLFGSALTLNNNDDYFCAGFPNFQPINELWVAQDGVADVSGMIEVTTTTNGPNSYLHTIVLKAVTFQKGNNTFYYGNAILLGNLLTTN